MGCCLSLRLLPQQLTRTIKYFYNKSNFLNKSAFTPNRGGTKKVPRNNKRCQDKRICTITKLQQSFRCFTADIEAIGKRYRFKFNYQLHHNITPTTIQKYPLHEIKWSAVAEISTISTIWLCYLERTAQQHDTDQTRMPTTAKMKISTSTTPVEFTLSELSLQYYIVLYKNTISNASPNSFVLPNG